MTTLQPFLEFLDRQRVRLGGRRGGAPSAGQDRQDFCERAGDIMAVLPADSRVELEDFRLVIGSPHLRLATETEIGRLFRESELGAMPRSLSSRERGHAPGRDPHELRGLPPPVDPRLASFATRDAQSAVLLER
jgi:hypothetical protein